jgi:pimeloyl-ACP methyl ester carboxylesterase
VVQRAEILGSQLEVRWIGTPPGQAQTIVFLHEGLGSVAMWRDFPDRVCAATGCGGLVYSRLGYGASDRVSGPRTLRFMHDEALWTLPAVLSHFRIENPILFGHSDGASIAIIYAGARLGPVRALILEAPHVFVEPVCIESISRIAVNDRVRTRLAKYHGDNTESMFTTWTNVWLAPGFEQWSIEESLPSITAPVLVIQGENDEYGTIKQLDAIVSQVRGPATSLLLTDCGHAPHVEQPDAVLDAVRAFVRSSS